MFHVENSNLTPFEIELIKEISKCDPVDVIGMAYHKVDTRLPQYDWKRVVNDLVKNYKENPEPFEEVFNPQAVRLLRSFKLNPMKVLSMIAAAMAADDLGTALKILKQFADECSAGNSNNEGNGFPSIGQSSQKEKDNQAKSEKVA